ncbi:hypothetical protein JCM10450v2_005588 [Rhodotorula kratochvilovae]
MSFAQLPADLLDLIFHHAGQRLDGGQLSYSDRRLYRRLCLVCRAFVPSARRILYRKPGLYTVAWDKAIQLYGALSNRNGYIGSLVHDLEGLAGWAHALASKVPPDVPLAFLIRGQSKVFSWMASMLAICPNLRRVSLTIGSSVEATKVIKALCPSFGTLTGVRLSPDVGQSLDTAIVKQFLRSVHRSECMLEFLPTQVGALRDLDLSLPASTSTDELLHILRQVGPSLANLKLAGPPSSTRVRDYDNYAVRYSNPVFPVERLSLIYFQALSVGSLESLVEHCPNLAVLDAVDSVWIADDPRLNVFRPADYQARVFPEHRARDLLSAFQRIKSVNLGYLPVRYHDTLVDLETAMENKGVYLEYTTCFRRCPSCGDYHY